MVSRGGGGRLVLVVDDAHRLDDLSAALIHQLVASDQCFVLITVLAPSVAEARAPEPIVALWNRVRCSRGQQLRRDRPQLQAWADAT